ncbi:hypothetical protein QE152_g25836 [Popillia japonica]|uniref:Uncharacterized protein n=1 Tax=Popillia japonica TaxID=7064 RepID=A0AAW1K0F9_POPJA
MADCDIRFARGSSLHEALAMLKKMSSLILQPTYVVMMPPDDDGETDEDSGQEDEMFTDNLPPTQLRALAEIHVFLKITIPMMKIFLWLN